MHTPSKQGTKISDINEYDKSANYLSNIKNTINKESLSNLNTTSKEKENINNKKSAYLNFFAKQNFSLITNNSLINLIKGENGTYIPTVQEKKPIIFLIRKIKHQNAKNGFNKRGRLKKGIAIPLNKTKHDKFSQDNLFQKIKVHFILKTFTYINELYKKYNIRRNKKNQPLLKRIDARIYKVFSKKLNKQFLSLKLSQLFSAEISDRYSNFLRNNSKDYNKRQIDLLIKENKATEVIEILNLTLEEMYQKYISNEMDEFCLNNDLVKIEEKEGIKYKEIFKENAENLISMLNKRSQISDKHI